MKSTAIPKQIHELTAAIQAKRTEIEQCRTDIDRAGEAARDAERLEQELTALSDKRARIKAEAFIARKKADLAELDRQEAELEKATRKAREDGKAGAMAVEMLETKIGEIDREIEQLEEQRKAKTLEWLTEQREKVVDRYLDALRALGPIVADAMAIDSAWRKVTDEEFRLNDVFKSVRKLEFPIPRDRQLDVGKFHDRYWRSPIEWLGDAEHGKREGEQFIADLQAAGVLT